MCVLARGVTAAVANGPVYLMYAGPYSSSPASAFGHLFIVSAPSDSSAMPLWDVYSFRAETNDSGPLRFMSIGVTGGFLGMFGVSRLHEQVRDYGALEDRDLWLMRLALSDTQKVLLHNDLTARQHRRDPYLFFSKNCAYYIQDVLSSAIDGIPAPSGAVSPIGVFDIIRRSGLCEEILYRPALSDQLRMRVSLLSAGTRSRLLRESWSALASDDDWLNALSTSDRRFVHDYFMMRSIRAGNHRASEADAGMRTLRLLAAVPDSTATTELRSGMSEWSPDHAVFHGYGKVSVSIDATSCGESHITLRHRAALHDVTDPWIGHRPVNTMDILTIAAKSRVGELRPRLEELTIFSQRSLGLSDFITKRSSWMIEVLGRRDDLLRKGAMHWHLRAGWGQCWLPMDATYVYALATGAAVNVRRRPVRIMPGLQAGALLMLSQSWRMGAEWDHSLPDGEKSTRWLTAWLRHDLSRDLGCAARCDYGNALWQVALELSWYY